MALGGGPISGEQEIADEVPGVDFAERIERDETAGVRGRGRVVAGRILVVHHALERLDRPPSQGLTAKESPLVELRAVAGREALEEVAEIEAAGPLELAAVAGLLELLRVDLQVDRRRPSNRRPVGCENVVAERELEAVQQPPQPRPYDLFASFPAITWLQRRRARPSPSLRPDRPAAPGLCARPAGMAGRPGGFPEIQALRTLNRAIVMRPAMTASGDAQGTRRC